MVGRRTLNLDRLGTFASGLCAVHCVLTGLAFGVLSAAGFGSMSSPLTEGLFFGTALLVGSTALVHGIRRHHSWAPGAFFALGMGLVAGGHLLFGHSSTEHLLSALGGACLVSFHILNARMSHRCGCDCKH